MPHDWQFWVIPLNNSIKLHLRFENNALHLQLNQLLLFSIFSQRHGTPRPATVICEYVVMLGANEVLVMHNIIQKNIDVYVYVASLRFGQNITHALALDSYFCIILLRLQTQEKKEKNDWRVDSDTTTA